MNPKELPARPSLEHLKTQAKDLLDAAKQGDPAAIARFRASLPSAKSGVDPSGLALHDAQSAIAREYGCESWGALRDRVLATPSEESLRSLFAMPHVLPIPREVLEATAAPDIAEPLPDARALPALLPLLALRNARVAVSTVAPLDVQRPATLAAIESAEQSDHLIVVFAQRDPAVDDPAAADFHPIGCVARVVRVVPKPEGAGVWLVVYGLAWVRLEALEDGRARVAPFDVVDDGPGPADALRARVKAAVAKLPEPDGVLRRIDRMSVQQLADAAVANAPCPVAAKAEYAAEPSLSRRVERALALIGG